MKEFYLFRKINPDMVVFYAIFRSKLLPTSINLIARGGSTSFGILTRKFRIIMKLSLMAI